MKDKIERLFEAIKPTNSHFSELVITELVDDIIRIDPQKARLLLPDIDHMLEEFLYTVLNSVIQECRLRVTQLNKMKDLFFLRICMELRNYEYDYVLENWKGRWIPYKDNTYGLLRPLEPFSNDEWGFYWFIKQNKKYIPLMPFNNFDNYFEWRWEIFKQRSPLFEALDTYNKLKEGLRLHEPYGVCKEFYGNTSVKGYSMMTRCIAKLIHASKSEAEISHSENNIATIRKNSGRKQTKFQDCINGKYESQSDEIIDRIKTLINNRKGKMAAKVLIAAIQTGYILNPEYAATMREFKNSNIVRRDFAKYLDKGQSPDLWADQEIEELKRKLTV